ncbi:protein N-lysine methyltransferase FAM173A [Puma concolor]|uniref:Protein N-lysine methyltransferase FAM173A n=1 Tax=Puma concolor TaxID=9696 RepID=A0A6P6HTE9_PUMCO|nr:protein N-lysine methyltransferase FAM173A [Puma concolor]
MPRGGGLMASGARLQLLLALWTLAGPARPVAADASDGGWAAGSGLAAYIAWALLLQPGFRRVPLRLQVPYVGASERQVEHVLSLLRGRPGKTVDLGSGDGRIVLAAHKCGLRPAVGYELNPWLVGLARLHAWRAGCAGSVCYLREDLWKVSLRDCHNVSVFLAPSVLPLLEDKLRAELPAGARVDKCSGAGLHFGEDKTDTKKDGPWNELREAPSPPPQPPPNFPFPTALVGGALRDRGPAGDQQRS